MRAVIAVALAGAVFARPALAQNEAALRAAFEGKTVTIKLDMPATSQGIDVHPLDGAPVDFRELAQRIKDNGTAIRTGQQIMITKVVVKRDSHIEFQLGGGGYGTFGDYVSNGSSVHSTSAGESREERALRDSIKAAPGPTKRKQFERQLDNVRDTRERENARAKADAEQANAARETNIRAKRLEAGSRFNIRYKNGIPPEALTPDGVRAALAQWVEFGPPTSTATATAVSATLFTAPQSQSAAGIASLKKGQSVKDVESILGPATIASEERQGAMTVTRRTYRKDGLKIVANFVGEVMVDFTISPA